MTLFQILQYKSSAIISRFYMESSLGIPSTPVRTRERVVVALRSNTSRDSTDNLPSRKSFFPCHKTFSTHFTTPNPNNCSASP